MRKQFVAASALFLSLIGGAQAAVPANVTTALSDALTDATTVAGSALIIVVGIAAFRYMRRAL